LTDVLGDLEYILLRQWLSEIMVIGKHFIRRKQSQTARTPVPLKGLLPPDNHRCGVVIHIRIDSCTSGSSRCNEDMIDNSSSKNNE
jgi:hypothetical protein